MIKLYLLLLFASIQTVTAQIFIITEFKVEGCKYDTKEKKQKDELKYLGEQIKLTFFDSKLKVLIGPSKEKTELLFTKVNSDTYIYTDDGFYGKETATIRLETFLGYIRLLRLTNMGFVGKTDKCTHLLTAKRE